MRFSALFLASLIFASVVSAQEPPTVPQPEGTDRLEATEDVSDAPDVHEQPPALEEAQIDGLETAEPELDPASADEEPLPRSPSSPQEAEPAQPAQPTSPMLLLPPQVLPAEEDASNPGAPSESQGGTLMDAHDVDGGGIRFEPGRGLQITSEDRRFRLRISTRVQFRYTIREDGGDLDHAFEIERARIMLSGYAFSNDVRFRLQLAVSPGDLGIEDNLSSDPLERTPSRSPLLDYYVELRLARDFRLRVGQTKLPSNHERASSSRDLQLVDRSILDGEFTLNRDVGISIRSQNFLGLELLRYHASISIARGAGSQGFDDFGLAYLGRLELHPFGTFDDQPESDFEGSNPRLALGVGGGFIDRARGVRGLRGRAPRDGGTTDTGHVFADATFRWAGFSASAEFAWRTGSRNPGTAVDEMGVLVSPENPRDGYGVNLQAGYVLPGVPIEVAGRFAMIRSAGLQTRLRDNNELGLGVSYYFAEHLYKVQLDYAHQWRTDVGDGLHQVRAQLSLSL